ncbi:cysteine-type endopeptidase [Kockovaella imperatae]|uniref:separase n=1 Tax=Kockovaella imperatae TaxID=4999 RepID=A0A1Y1UPZ2_9TREE|nr:cysteine-type endopeptidase [Kockovaella imperatae]ORX39637.1 cysteine-type endopeptidase [Kockovaella imperatae]
MSSLTESTIAMPMGSSKGRMRDRQSTRDSIQIILERSQDAYLRALEMSAASGRVEEVRSACLSLALLRAFQTSLGQGSEIITAAAAEMLASTPAITLHRELLEKIEHKLADGPLDDTKWPVLKRAVTMDHPTSVADSSTPVKGAENIDEACLVLSSSPKQTDRDSAYREYWKSVRARYRASFLQVDQEQVDSLPAEWVIVTINVTEDKNTMFISRHQRDREPLVFTLPLDRQGRRDGEAEEDLFTFDAAKEQMKRIIDESNDGARNAKHVTSQAGKTAWWEKRYSLDKQLKELVANLEFCWLGAFKTILSPRPALSQSALETFGARLERIFHSAIAGGARASDVKTRVQLDTPLLECFAALSSKCRDEEAEDLVYFILDVYQFHGVPVALAELDIDLIGIDLRSALAELEASRPSSPQPSETVFLALDKNVSCFPWESIPILRGRNASRVPSLPFLLHQWSMRDLIYPLASEQGKILVDSKKVFYILNPSGDLSRTQTHFEPWIQSMEKQAGWKGIMGRPPTELELEAVLKEYDLVLYFGHGGAEQYIHSHRVSKLTRCATTMLWGCSSGALVDQGDFDVRGTAWSYMMAGCPALVGTLWDVTDRDIDRLSESVFSKLHLDPSHVSSSTTAATTMLPISAVSLPEAVAKSRDECKLTYLTGAAPVVYGLPIWM